MGNLFTGKTIQVSYFPTPFSFQRTYILKKNSSVLAYLAANTAISRTEESTVDQSSGFIDSSDHLMETTKYPKTKPLTKFSKLSNLSLALQEYRLSEDNLLNSSHTDLEQGPISVTLGSTDPLNITSSVFLRSDYRSAVTQLAKTTQLEESSPNSRIYGENQDDSELSELYHNNNLEGSGSDTDENNLYGHLNVPLIDYRGLTITEESGSGSGHDSDEVAEALPQFATFLNSAFSLNVDYAPEKSTAPQSQISAATEEGGVSSKLGDEKLNEMSDEENNNGNMEVHKVKVTAEHRTKVYSGSGSGAEDGSGSGEPPTLFDRVELNQGNGDREHFKVVHETKYVSKGNGIHSSNNTISHRAVNHALRSRKNVPTANQTWFRTNDEKLYVSNDKDDQNTTLDSPVFGLGSTVATTEEYAEINETKEREEHAGAAYESVDTDTLQDFSNATRTFHTAGGAVLEDFSPLLRFIGTPEGKLEQMGGNETQ